MAKANEKKSKLPPIPGWLISVVVISVVASWIPLALIAVHRVQLSERQRVHIFQDMGVQPRGQAQDPSAIFADGRTMRLPVAGTVARGELREDDHFYRGYETDDQFEPVMDEGTGEPAYFDDFPEQIAVSRELLQRGRTAYEVNCATCHGTAGYGDGQTQRHIAQIQLAAEQEGRENPALTWVPPFNLHERDAEGLVYGGERYPAGKMFHVISDGIRTMPAYKHQIGVEDRWALVAYVQALQLSQALPADEAPEGLDVAALADPTDPEPTVAEPADDDRIEALVAMAEEADLEAPELVAEGEQLFMGSKICFTCHQVDPNVDPLNPAPGPSFVEGIFGLQREVEVGIGGPTETVVVDEEYFIESLLDPQALITAGYGPPAMMPPMEYTDEEVLALMAYVRSLGTHDE